MVEIHEGNFPPAAPDEDWLPIIGQNGWVLLTKDEKIRYRAAEKRAIAQHLIRAFFLVPTKLTGPENGEVFVKALRRMERFCVGNQPPFIAKVFRNGTVKLWERPRP